MRNKILQELKTKYSHLGLGDEFLSFHADVLQATGLITDENLIDLIEKQKPYLEQKQKDTDKLRTHKAELERRLKESEDRIKALTDGGGTSKEKEPEGGKGDMPQWAKDLSIKLDALKQENETLKQESEQAKLSKLKSERSANILSIAKELGITEERIKQGFVIADDADDAAIRTQLSEIRKYEVAQGLETEKGFPLSTDKDAIAAEAKAWAEQLN